MAKSPRSPRGTLRRRFGERIRHLRKVRGWTQQGLADRAGMDYKYVGSVERGEMNLTIDNIERFCAAFGVEAFHLFFFGADPERVPQEIDARRIQDLLRDVEADARPLLLSIFRCVAEWKR